MRGRRRIAWAERGHQGSGGDAGHCGPLIKPKAREDRGLRLAPPCFFHEPAEAGEDEVQACDQVQRRVQKPQARDYQRNESVTQYRVDGRGVQGPPVHCVIRQTRERGCVYRIPMESGAGRP